MQRTSVKASFTESFGRSISRVDVDNTGPIDAAGHWRYRLVAAEADGQLWHRGKYKRQVVSPMVTFSPNSTSRYWARFEYQFADIQTTSSAPWFVNAKNQLSTFIPIDSVPEDPWGAARIWQYATELGAEHSFFDHAWTTRITVRSNRADRNHKRYQKNQNNSLSFYDKSGVLIGTDTSAAVNFDDPSIFGSIIMQRFFQPEVQFPRNTSVYWDNVINLKLGPTQHQVLAYGSYTKKTDRNLLQSGAGPTIDRLHPVYNDVFNPTNVPLTIIANTESKGNLKAYGVQDAISILNNRLIMVGGIRRDSLENNNLNKLNNARVNTAAEADSYKLGVVGKIHRGVSLFYNYAETFTPQFGTYVRYPDLVLVARENQLSSMNEYGAKIDLLDSRIIATGSYYVIEGNNNIGAAPVVNGTPTSTQLGDQITKGWDIDIAAQPTPRLAIMGGVSNLTSKSATGLWVRGVSQGLSYKAFTKYSFADGPLTGVSVGVGYDYTNKRAGDSADTFRLDPYHLWESMLKWQGKNVSVQLNVYNLRDKRYAVSGVARNSVWPGDPRTFRFSMEYKF